ncbi:MAG: hypothetical protein OEY14_16680 [Myxococcales bacterium]|nr:hypothetical protein [Myxococcales bacterium]
MRAPLPASPSSLALSAFCALCALSAPLGLSSIAAAQPLEPAEPSPERAEPFLEPEVSGFDHAWALGGSLSGWAGQYQAAGLGGYGRWEPFKRLGIEVFSQHLLVRSPEGLRHDHPIGFDLYVPFALSERFRLRPLFGMCVNFSFVEPDQALAPRADDILFGLHLGGVAETLLLSWLSVFLRLKVIGYAGHGRTISGWTGTVGGDLAVSMIGEADLGLQIHFGGR